MEIKIGDLAFFKNSSKRKWFSFLFDWQTRIGGKACHVCVISDLLLGGNLVEVCSQNVKQLEYSKIDITDKDLAIKRVPVQNKIDDLTAKAIIRKEYDKVIQATQGKYSWYDTCRKGLHSWFGYFKINVPWILPDDKLYNCNGWSANIEYELYRWQFMDNAGKPVAYNRQDPAFQCDYPNMIEVKSFGC